MSRAGSLRLYFQMEARSFALRGPVVALVAGAILTALSHALVPRLPQAALEVMEKSFRIRGVPEILLMHDYLVIQVVLFFGGLAELLRALVAPREERHLSLLLSKPVPAEVLVRARVVPVLVAVWLAGGVLGIGATFALAPWMSESSLRPAGVLGGAVVLGSLTVALLALLVPLLVRMRDGFDALIASFALWIVPLMPMTAYLYRPDLFEGRAALAQGTVLPVNLAWAQASMPVTAVLATAAAAGVAAIVLRVGARIRLG
ncbi:MAG: hypothetical protein R3B70_30015 [Polyangiaceae bacterium]